MNSDDQDENGSLNPVGDPASISDAAASFPTEREIGTVAGQPTAERYFDRYRVEGELGRGGMGVVLLARDEELNKQVALKLLPIEVACDLEAIADLKKEVLRGMTLLHPGIVRVFNFERDARGVAIVMEYIAGETLTERRRREPGECFDYWDILPWIEELCSVLEYAHGEAHIAHRDLKPRNIIVTPEGHVKVADFGLAAGLSNSLTRSTLNCEASGTPPYMSPQQVRGETPTHYDDIYALGATIFELLTGKPPFYRGNVLAQVLQATPPSIEQRRAERGIAGKEPVPAAWEHAIAACLAKDPAGRPPSAMALCEWLRDGKAAHALHAEEPAVRIVRPAKAVESTGEDRPVRVGWQATESRLTISVQASDKPQQSPSLKSLKTSRHPAQDANRFDYIVALLKRAAFVLGAAALTAGGAYAMRHGTAPGQGPTTKTEAASPRPETVAPLGKSALEPARSLAPARLEQPPSGPNR